MFNKLQKRLLEQDIETKDTENLNPAGYAAAVKKWSPFALICVLLLLSAGCTNKEDIPNGIRVSYQSWVGVVAVAVGLLASIGGWFAKNTGFRGWIFFIFALLGLLLFSPFGFVDHVTVTDQQISTQWGFWIAPTKHEFRFDDIKSVELTEETKSSRRGTTTNYYFVFRLNNGNKEKLIASNSLMERATQFIIEQLSLRGVQIVDRTRR